MRITYADGSSEDVKPLLVDRLAVEKRGLGSVAVIEAAPLQYAARLAHTALVRANGRAEDSYADWVATVEELDMGDEADPTQQGPGTGSDSS